MKYIIFSDVHSNLEALLAFLKLTDEFDGHIRLCLGDIVGYGSSPNECLDMIHERDIPVVMGNHDYALVDNGSEKMSFNWIAREAIEWHASVLRYDNLKRIQNFPFVQIVDSTVSIAHSNFNVPADFIYLFDKRQAAFSFSGLKTQVGFFGHTHLPSVFTEEKSKAAKNRVSFDTIRGSNYTFAIEPGKRYLINPGSLGQPRDGDSRASYVVMDTDKMTCTFRRLSYDYHSESRRMLDRNLPKALARRILVGQ